MITATQIRKGMIVVHAGEPHRVLEFRHRTPGKGRAFVQVKLRNLRTGASYDYRYASGDAIERAAMEQREMEFLYRQASHYHFMDTANYESLILDQETLGNFENYLKENSTIQVEFFEDQPIGVEMPSAVELRVVSTEPELKGATASHSPKPATLETGVVIQVPPFIREGDLVRVDPNQGNYLERVS